MDNITQNQVGQQEVRDILLSEYGLYTDSIDKLQANNQKTIYKINIHNEKPLLFRAFPIEKNNAHVAPDFEVLNFLESQNYPASRIIKSKDHHDVIHQDNFEIIVTTFIEGRETKYNVNELRLLGEALGKLHSLPLEPTQTELPQAGMLPRKEVSWIKQNLDQIKDIVDSKLLSRYETLSDEIDNINLLEELPRCLIHNDAHPGNSIYTKEKVIYIDWEGAGIGTAIIDLGFLLMNAELGNMFSPVVYKPELGDAVLDGYLKYHTLSEEECRKLNDAIRFRLLVFGSASFISLVQGKQEEEAPYWWERYLKTEDLYNRIANKINKHAILS